jgi:putative photosynthetic complex assembly protein 2
MWPELVPALFALLVWWSTTGMILLLNRLDQRSFAISLAGGTGLLVAGLFGLRLTATDESVAGAYLAFVSAILVWAWLEMSFLMGFITGPQRESLPEDKQERGRFREAVRAILYHEIAILVVACLVAWLTIGAINPFGALTFLVLWVMRISAKLNLFLGVQNLGREYLPPHLAYLGSYFRQRKMNLLFPFSVTAGTWLAFQFFMRATDAISGGETVGYTIVATLTGLAVLEHWFMVLPLRSEVLWRWSLNIGRDFWPKDSARLRQPRPLCREDAL